MKIGLLSVLTLVLLNLQFCSVLVLPVVGIRRDSLYFRWEYRDVTPCPTDH